MQKLSLKTLLIKLAVITFFQFNPNYGQNSGSIYGFVTDSSNGEALIGANVAYEGGSTAVSGILAFVAVVLAMINVVGGFAVTNRMLNMIAGKKRGGA